MNSTAKTEGGKAKFIIKMMVTECMMCGERSPWHNVVLGAGGHYCKTCSPMAAAMAERSRINHLAKGMANGVISVPSPLWWPPMREVESVPIVPRVKRRK